MPPILYKDRDNLLLAIVKDSDGNGVPGIDVTVTTDDAQSIEATSNTDGYISVFIEGPSALSELDVTVTTDASPAKYTTMTYQVADEIAASPAGLYLVSQEFQVARASDSITQRLELQLLNASGVPVDDTGTYQIWCSDPNGNDGPHSFRTWQVAGPAGIGVLAYAPSVVGRYVATFTVGGQTKYVGWELVERI